MPTYEITGMAEAVRDWQSNLGGPMRSYRIDLKGDDGTDEPLIEWARKLTSPIPTVGMKLEGNIETGQYGKKFKTAPSVGGGFGAGSKDFKADPVKQAAIAMEHSQKAAIDILTLAAVHAEGYTLPVKVSEIAEQVRLVAKSLYEQIHAVSEAAK